MVWEQYRSVQAGEVDLSNLDLEISVTKPKDDPLEFEVATWNLTEESWGRISDGDLCRIELGWAEGDVETVCLGEIDTRKRVSDQGDIKFELAGLDETAAATRTRPDGRTWENKRPDQIAADIISEIGLSPQTEHAGEPIWGNWPVAPDKMVSDWLDDLLQIAAENTGEEWEWFATRGQVFFMPRSEETEEAPQLSYGGMLVSVGEKSDTDDDAEDQLEFEAMLEPRITKGAAVHVDTDAYSGAYRVSDYEFKSSTITGDHLVQGTLTPVDADYSIG